MGQLRHLIYNSEAKILPLDLTKEIYFIGCKNFNSVYFAKTGRTTKYGLQEYKRLFKNWDYRSNMFLTPVTNQNLTKLKKFLMLIVKIIVLKFP